MRKVDYSRRVQGLHVLVYTVNNETSFFSARKNVVNKIYIYLWVQIVGQEWLGVVGAPGIQI